MDSRRKFIKKGLWAGAGLVVTTPVVGSFFGKGRYESEAATNIKKSWVATPADETGAPKSSKATIDLAAIKLPVKGKPTAQDFKKAGDLVEKAIDALGGMSRFIRRGDTVYIKPNIGWARGPEYAATTNPDVVKALVRLSYEAGAKRVMVGDRTCEEPKKCYRDSRIQAAAESVEGRVVFPKEYKKIKGKFGVASYFEIDKNYLEADKIINVPIAKHHGLSGATIAMKNLYGILGGNRGRLHQKIHESIAELAYLFKPTLNVVDGIRVLGRNGPQGGSLDYVTYPMTIVAGVDPVAVDAFSLQKLFGDRFKTASSFPNFIKKAESFGAGSSNLANMNVFLQGFPI